MNKEIEERVVFLLELLKDDYDGIEIDVDDDADIDEYIESVRDEYDGSLENFAFDKAVEMGCYPYVEDHISDFDLNCGDEGECPWIYKTDDQEIIDLLMNYGANRAMDDYQDYRFAYCTTTDYIISFDSDLQEEAFQKFLEQNELSESEIIENYDDYSDELESIGISVEDGEIIYNDMESEDCGYAAKDVLESLGYELAFEGDSNKFETNGYYFLDEWTGKCGL